MCGKNCGKNWENKVSDTTNKIYEENIHYIDRSIDSIYKYFESNGITWGISKEKITRAMINETIIDLIDTIVESDEKMDCDEAGTGGIIIRVEKLEEDYDLTILLEF